jgi:N4-gp56 family major capsid protein
MAAWSDPATSMNTTTNAVFIPEVWSDEVIMAYKKALVIANIVKKWNFVGKKGDVVHVPKPTRGAASAKVKGVMVTLQAATDSELTVSINKHYEYSRLIEDILVKQAIASMRGHYTDDAGYALAKQVENDLTALFGGLNGGTAYSTAVIGSDGKTVWDGTAATNTGNGASISDAGFRRLIQTLDDNDVPMDDRNLIVPPSEKNVLLGIARFVSSDYNGGVGNAVKGQFGELYGVKVFTSTNLPTVQAADSSTNYKACVLMHRDALVHVEQQKVRSQTQYKQEYLADLFTADTVYGVSEYRDECGVPFIVPA